ncbi:MAG: 4-diphosphocytidyl-2C-methyl-D-erythritol kinase [Alphaproteobacteria bacterium]|nr:4-diphosphocytidyl-2C-methyl-D-erythritol kinase [Alphaproteobacteria bacterium]
MKFVSVPVDQAVGALLAHSLVVTGIGKLLKGHRLSTSDVAALGANGRSTVTVVRLDTDDIGENDGAAAAAAALVGRGTRTSGAFTGRANLHAIEGGVVVIDASSVNELNAVHESLTLATVAPFDVATPDQMIATIKVIPLAVPKAALDAWRTIAARRPPIKVAPLRDFPVGLILTRLPGLKESVLDKTSTVQTGRLTVLGSHLKAERRCAHTIDDVAVALDELRRLGCRPILIFGGSAVIDRRDVVPSAIERLGGTVDRLGMPVDPGNLLMLAHLGEITVLGLPGSARSPRLNGFDFVLRRVLANLPVTGADLAQLGVGGLLKDVPGRPQPRELPAAEPVSVPGSGVAAIVLAAGQSRRMGSDNKLVADIGGVPMVRRSVESILGTDARPVLIVTGHQADRIKAALQGLGVTFVDNPRYGEGLSSSLAAGIEALPTGSAATLVCLADMPEIKPHHLNRLIESFKPSEGRTICVPTRRGKRGNPVLWGADYFNELKQVSGDVGARHLIGEYADQVYEVVMDDDAIFLDLDTPDALESFRRKVP